MTIDFKSILQQLEQRRNTYDEAIRGIRELAAVEGVSLDEGGGSAVVEQPAAVPARKKPTKKVKANGHANSGLHCAKHPSAEFTAKETCKMCQREYNQAYVARKKKSAAVAEKPNGHAEPAAHGIKCDQCPQRFPNARELGQHKTREHFGSSSHSGSSLGGI